ncbi:MAG: DUF2442 domain-containing protein [Clostridiales bacterium]|jgi:hypothetical protein|nr:DUF2442 domain-containing protein [Clostridiales bacterium]
MNYPVLQSVRALDDYTLVLVYGATDSRVFDVAPYIKGDWYGELRDISYFKSVRIAGKTVAWPDGQDLAPHELYENSMPLGQVRGKL